MSNLDLALLVAYQLAQNWDGRINLCMAVEEEAQEKAEAYLSELMSLVRLPPETNTEVFVQPFMEAVKSAPAADLNIFGLAHDPDLHFCQRLSMEIDTSCVFMRDSGEESAMA